MSYFNPKRPDLIDLLVWLFGAAVIIGAVIILSHGGPSV